MGARISYTDPDENGICESIHSYVSKRTGAVYRIKLDVKKVKYTIANIEGRHYYHSDDSIKNLNVLKRNVKKRLIGMGVEFESEKRKRTFGLCPKGYNQEVHTNKKESENLSN